MKSETESQTVASDADTVAPLDSRYKWLKDKIMEESQSENVAFDSLALVQRCFRDLMMPHRRPEYCIPTHDWEQRHCPGSLFSEIVGPEAKPAAQPGKMVNLCTFNLLAQKMLEKGYAQGPLEIPKELQWSSRKMALVNSMRSPMRSFDGDRFADIYAVQELETATFESLFEEDCLGSDFHGVFLRKYNPAKDREGQGLFVRKSVWKIIQVDGAAFSEPDFGKLHNKPTEGFWPHKALIAVLERTDEKRQKIIVSVSHFGASGRGVLPDEFLRRMMLEEMHQRTKQISLENGGIPYFLCVDQNAEATDQIQDYHTQAGLSSVLPPTVPTHNTGFDGGGDAQHQHDFIYYDHANDATFIAARTGDINKMLRSRETFSPEMHVGGSDHAPIFASFHLTSGDRDNND